MKTEKLLIAVLLLQAVMLLNQWFGSPISVAQAQIPDAGEQRNQVIEALKTNNDELKAIDGKLGKLLSVLDSGKLQVQLSKPDDKQ